MILLGLLGCMSACSLALASCSDNGTGAPPPAKPTVGALALAGNEPNPSKELWSPDTALALIPDIEGYFRDCNCSGMNVGGLERIPDVANAATDLRLIFYGDTLFPSEGSAAGKALSQASAVRIARSTIQLWRALGNVRWLPSKNDLESLRVHGITLEDFREFVADSELVRLDDISVRPGSSDAILALEVDGKTYEVTAPARGATGKQIGVVGVWRNRLRADGIARLFSRTLGVVAMQKPAEGSPAGQSMSKELARSGVMLGYWQAYLTAKTPSDSVIADLIDEHEFRIAHGSAILVARDAELRRLLAESVKECGGCHAAAVDAWLESRHARAYETLRNRRQQGNPRCLPCHVENAQTFAGGTSLGTQHAALAAVTCGACHRDDRKVALALCETCHTKHTDPQRHYFAKIGTICPGDLPRKKEGQSCSRR